MMIHWGLSAVVGRHAWAIHHEEMPWGQYEAALDGWEPVEDCADRWLGLAAEGGMKYAVLIAKHHDGFCLWDTDTTDFSSAARGPGRDFVAEYVEACRRHGVRPGLYFSLWDIHHPDVGRAREDETARRRLVDFTHAQIEELMTRYGDICTLWYDVPIPLSPEQWEHEKINARVRRWQPGILLNDRMDVMGDYATMDYGTTPERAVEVAEPGRDWEVALPTTMSWAYIQGCERDSWSARWLLRILATATGNGGNMLLDIGPQPDGTVLPVAVERIRTVGRWLERHGEAVYGDKMRVRRGPVELPRYGTGTWTADADGSVYAWLYYWFGSERAIGHFPHRVRSATLLGTGQPVAFEQAETRLLLRNLPEENPEPVAGVPVVKLAIEQSK
jgi:alpha-L-fucosidase